MQNAVYMFADLYILVESTLVFYFLVHEELKKLWIKFVKKKDQNPIEQNYIKMGEKSMQHMEETSFKHINTSLHW